MTTNDTIESEVQPVCDDCTGTCRYTCRRNNKPVDTPWSRLRISGESERAQLADTAPEVRRTLGSLVRERMMRGGHPFP